MEVQMTSIIAPVIVLYIMAYEIVLAVRTMAVAGAVFLFLDALFAFLAWVYLTDHQAYIAYKKRVDERQAARDTIASIASIPAFQGILDGIDIVPGMDLTVALRTADGHDVHLSTKVPACGAPPALVHGRVPTHTYLPTLFYALSVVFAIAAVLPVLIVFSANGLSQLLLAMVLNLADIASTFVGIRQALQ